MPSLPPPPEARNGSADGCAVVVDCTQANSLDSSAQLSLKLCHAPLASELGNSRDELRVADMRAIKRTLGEGEERLKF